MKNKLARFIPLILILGIASLLRIGLLGKYPVSLNVDEVAIGYDAFSIINSGRDIHKDFMPLVFQSLGDYKPGFYIYLTVLSELVFGINEFAVRFPAALAGVITVLFMFLTILEMTNNRRLSLIAAFVLAVSPWHLKMSRGAFEANVALCLLLVGFYLTMVAIKNGRRMNWGIVAMALSLYTYHSEKIIAPIMLFLVGFVFRKKINKKTILWWLLTFVIVMIPFLFLLDGNNQTRLSTKILFNDPEITIFLSRAVNFVGLDKLVLAANSIFRRYIEFLDFGYLLNKGLDMTHSLNFDLGWIYWLEFPFLIFGVIQLFRNRNIFIDKKYLYCFLLWLIISSIPASITMDSYHPYRLLSLVVPFSFIIALGIYRFIEFGNKIGLGKIFGSIIVLFYIVNLAYFLDYYLVQFPSNRSDWLFEPSKEVAMTALENMNKYNKVVVDPNFGKDGPYIVSVPELYILFYGKIKPQDYWANQTDKGFYNFEFRKIDWYVEKNIKNNLLIGSTWSLPDNEAGSPLIKTINFANGQAAYYVVDTTN